MIVAMVSSSGIIMPRCYVMVFYPPLLWVLQFRGAAGVLVGYCPCAVLSVIFHRMGSPSDYRALNTYLYYVAGFVIYLKYSIYTPTPYSDF